MGHLALQLRSERRLSVALASRDGGRVRLAARVAAPLPQRVQRSQRLLPGACAATWNRARRSRGLGGEAQAAAQARRQ
eukprot:5517059-Pyramimonas_sp.AAC.1